MGIWEAARDALVFLFAWSGLYIILFSVAGAVALGMPSRRSLLIWAGLSSVASLWLVGWYLQFLVGGLLSEGTGSDGFVLAVFLGGAIAALVAGFGVGIVLQLPHLRTGTPKAPIAPLPPNL